MPIHSHLVTLQSSDIDSYKMRRAVILILVRVLLCVCRLLETNQKLENDCTKLQSTVCTLELAVSDADKEVAHLTELHQQTLDIERYAIYVSPFASHYTECLHLKAFIKTGY